MPSSYMDLNQTNQPLDYGMTSGQVIVNVLVDKNIIVVQYNESGDTDPGDARPGTLITVKTKVSKDFGASWNDVTLSSGGKDFNSFDVATYQQYGNFGCIAEFMIRNSTGTKFLLYSPVYQLKNYEAGYMTITPRRQMAIKGWLVHNQDGTLVSSDANIMPDHSLQTAAHFGWWPVESSTSSSLITNYNTMSTEHGNPFYSFPVAPNSDAHFSGTYNSQRTVNKVDTVDYSSGGKRYTIVKRYYDIFVRRGDILKQSNEAPEFNINDVCPGFFVFTLPYIYVFNHDDFTSGNPKLAWVDIFQLETNLAKMKDYLRPTPFIHSYVKSLISEDKDFHRDVFYAKGYAKVPMNSGVGAKVAYLSLMFENTPHGELMKVHDKEAGRDLLGLIFGNRRFVCVDNPLVATNWVLGQTKRQHRHPTEKRAFYYRRQMPFASMDPRYMPGRLSSTSHDMYSVYYKKYDTFNLTHQNLRLDIGGDRVVAIPDRNYSADGEVRYRYAYFIKDTSTGRYSIGLRSEGVNVGTAPLTGSNHQGGGHYPLVVTRALGLAYSSETFIAREPLGVYTNPFLVADTAAAPESSVDCLYEPTKMDPDDLEDVYNGTGHTTTQYCTGFQRATRATHTASGMVYDLLTAPFSSSCGYNSAAPQSPRAFKLRVQKNLNVGIAGSKKYHALIDCVFTGAKQIILRPKLEDLNDWDFKVTSNTISVTFLKPEEFGLTSATATHTLNIGQDNTITTANNYSESTNPTDWRAASCEANSYETLGSTGGTQQYYFNGVRTGDNVTLRVENGPVTSTITTLTIGGQAFPFLETGTVVPYSVLASASTIEVS